MAENEFLHLIEIDIPRTFPDPRTKPRRRETVRPEEPESSPAGEPG